MPTVTLAESAKLTNDMLLSGVIESIHTVDRFFEVLPFTSIEGNAIAYNREGLTDPLDQDALVRFYNADSLQTMPFDHTDAGVLGAETASPGGITSKSPATFQRITSTLTTIIGDAEVNGLIQATRSDFNDQRGVQVAAKAKAAGRRYRNTLINGDGLNDTFVGLANLCPAAQSISVGDPGGALAFTDLDALMDLVVDKDGEVDYMIMSAAALRNYLQLLRNLGGAAIGEVVTLPSGTQVPAYRQVPIFRNDFVPNNLGVGTNETLIFAGTLDDGSGLHGIAGLTAVNAAGVQVENVGIHQYKDETITRVKWYCGLALYSELGIACLSGHIPANGVI